MRMAWKPDVSLLGLAILSLLALAVTFVLRAPLGGVDVVAIALVAVGLAGALAPRGRALARILGGVGVTFAFMFGAGEGRIVNAILFVVAGVVLLLDATARLMELDSPLRAATRE